MSDIDTWTVEDDETEYHDGFAPGTLPTDPSWRIDADRIGDPNRAKAYRLAQERARIAEEYAKRDGKSRPQKNPQRFDDDARRELENRMSSLHERETAALLVASVPAARVTKTVEIPRLIFDVLWAHGERLKRDEGPRFRFGGKERSPTLAELREFVAEERELAAQVNGGAG